MPNNKKFAINDPMSDRLKDNTYYKQKRATVASLENGIAAISVKDDDVSHGNPAANDEFSENRLFISNFPFEWSEDDLRNFLKEFEPVESVEIVYNERGSKGFGFATINDSARCLAAREKLNGSIADGRRVEIRRAHKHKRASNSGPPSGYPQNAAETIQHIQNLSALLLTQLPNIPQSMAIQAALATQPTILTTLLQNQFAAANILNNYRAGSSQSMSNIPTTFDYPMSAPQPAFGQQDTTPVRREGSVWKTPVRPKSEHGETPKLAETPCDDIISRRWPHAPRNESSPITSHGDYRLFDSPTLEHRGMPYRGQPITTAASTMGVDEEGHIVFSHVPMPTPIRRAHNLSGSSYSVPDGLHEIWKDAN